MIVEPGNDEERTMGRDSGCVIVREAAVGVRVARLGSHPSPQCPGENDNIIGAAGKSPARGP